jgi:hypothetical protein
MIVVYSDCLTTRARWDQQNALTYLLTSGISEEILTRKTARPNVFYQEGVKMACGEDVSVWSWYTDAPYRIKEKSFL